MTTVAYRDGVMACDSQLTGGFKSVTPSKVVIGRSKMVGFCGDYASGYAGAQYLAEEASDKPESHSDDDNEYIVTDGKRIWLADTRLRLAPVGDKFWAVGSGGIAAMAAMYAGADAETAVKIAIKVDEYSGGKVRTFKLG